MRARDASTRNDRVERNLLRPVTGFNGQRRANELLRDIARGLSGSSGEHYFHALTRYLVQSLRMDYAFIGELTGEDRQSIVALSFCAHDRIRDNFRYDLRHTPCRDVLHDGPCTYPSEVRKRFPLDRRLADLNAECYAGMPLFGADGEPIGVLAVLDTAPLKHDPQAVEGFLQILAAQAAAELQRRPAQAEPRASAASLAEAQRIARLGNWDWDIAGNRLFWSDEIYRIFGLSPREFGATYEAFLNAVHPDDRAQVNEAVARALNENRPYNIEHRIVLPTGEVRAVHERAEVTFDPDGKPVRMIGTVQDITERMQIQERLQYLAHHDALTELPNRVLFLDRLDQALARAERRRRIVGVMFLDLDRFKNINDTLGHDVGDRFLKVMATRLKGCVREGDTVARLGGDEFAVLLEEIAEPGDAAAVADKILSAFSQPFGLEGREFSITPSIGVSLYPNDGADATALLKNADAAMYRAKDLGRNHYQFYSADLAAPAVERLALETSLRRALERAEFALHYQPQVELASGRVSGMEALLRWRHPEFGLISAVQFIALAEETGVIVPIGAWVLREARTQARAWRALDLGLERVSVNISSRELGHAGFPDVMRRILFESELPAAELEFEIAERAILPGAQTVSERLRLLRGLGVRLAIDDFGAGSSSFSHLRRFPVHTLKIGKTCIDGVDTRADAAEVAKAIIALAHGLKLRVVAAGVETREQVQFLRAQGCDAIQGHLFSRPLPAAEATSLLLSGRRLHPVNP